MFSVGAARSSVARIDWGALIARPPPWWKGGRAFMSAPFLCGVSMVLEMLSPTEARLLSFPPAAGSRRPPKFQPFWVLGSPNLPMHFKLISMWLTTKFQPFRVFCTQKENAGRIRPLRTALLRFQRFFKDTKRYPKCESPETL